MNAAELMTERERPHFTPLTGKFPVLVIAHRGFSGIAPENTRTAFNEAIEIGSDMMEFDVRLSKDGQVVVIHDPTLERTTNGRGNVGDFILKELQQLDAGLKFGPQFAGERILLLREVLHLAKGRVLVNIEIKNGSIPSHKLMELADRTFEEVEKTGMVKEALFSSFHPAPLDRIEKKHPQALGALLYHGPWKDLQEVTHHRPYSILNLHHIHLTKEKVAMIHKTGMKVMVYTVDPEEEMEKFIRWGVDGIITNQPQRLINVLARKGKPSESKRWSQSRVS